MAISENDVGLIVFVCVFGSAILGVFLGKLLPDRHLNNDAKDIVKLATGLIATLAALVLGLLVSSAKARFDQVNSELMQVAVKVVLLDRVLAQYGPEAKGVRALLRATSPPQPSSCSPVTSRGKTNWTLARRCTEWRPFRPVSGHSPRRMTGSASCGRGLLKSPISWPVLAGSSSCRARGRSRRLCW